MRNRQGPPRETTRRRKALYRTGILLLTVIVFQTLHLYGFLPSGGVRYAEELLGTGRTTIVKRIYNPAEQWNRVTFLSGNQHAVMLTQCRFSVLYGWLDSTRDVIDCSRRQEMVYGNVSLRGTGDEETWRTDGPVRSFGRVDDDRVETVEMRFVQSVGYDEQRGETVSKELFRQTSHRSDWLERDGHTYFLMETAEAEWPADTGIYPVLTALDARGTVLRQYSVYDWAMGQDTP